MRGLWDHPDRIGWFGGGKDHPGIHSICVDPRDPRVLRLGVSSGGVWRSDDDGATWRCTADGLYAEYMPPEQRHVPHIQDVHRLAQCRDQPERLWIQHHNGVFSSVDGGGRWTAHDHRPPAKFGFAVAVHPARGDTAWFAPAIKDEHRIPVDGAVVVTRTTDGGAGWDVLRNGLPQTDAYDLVYRHALEVDADGETLAMGSTTGNLWLSPDGGERWQHLSAHLPPIHAVHWC